MTLRIVPPVSAVEHRAVCSVDGESWPCKHHRQAMAVQGLWRFVICSACGQRRNYWTALSIDRGLDGRAIYFHDRKRCRPKAEKWWNENVRPITGESFHSGQSIADLQRYLAARVAIQAVT